MKRADILKINVMCYWRFERKCPIVALEYHWSDSDVIAVTKDDMVIDTEVKVTIQDLKREKKKTKHYAMAREKDLILGHESMRPYIPASTRCNYFYFAVPDGLEEKAIQVINEMFPYAGLLVVRPNDFYQWDNGHYIVPPVYSVRKSLRFNRSRLTERDKNSLIKSMGTTACKMAFEILSRER